jgi:putative hydroxymethylpyrimidine transport system substrate-binding protein
VFTQLVDRLQELAHRQAQRLEEALRRHNQLRGDPQIGQKVHQTPTVFPANQLGVPNYDELIRVANSKRLKSDSAYAAMIRKFIVAMFSAAAAARANRAAATSIIGKATQYDSTFLKSSVPLTLSLLKPSSAKIGWRSAKQRQSFGRRRLNKKLIKKPVKASKVMTTPYLSGC